MATDAVTTIETRLTAPAGTVSRLAADIRYKSPGLTPFVTMALSDAGQRVNVSAHLGLAALDMDLAVMAEQTAPSLGPVTHGIRLELSRRY